MVKKLKIYDFDKTLVKTLDKEEGVAEWEATIGEVYPHKGWFGKLESLDPRIAVEVNPSVVLSFLRSVEEGNVNIFLTGRIPKFYNRIMEILKEHDLDHFDEYLLCNKQSTLPFKLGEMERIFNQYNPSEVEIFDDRYEHCYYFYKLVKKRFGRRGTVQYVLNGEYRTFTSLDFIGIYIKSKFNLGKFKFSFIFE